MSRATSERIAVSVALAVALAPTEHAAELVAEARSILESSLRRLTWYGTTDADDATAAEIRRALADTGDDPGPFDRVLDDLADSPSALDCLTVAQSSLAVLLTATAPDERRAALQGVASGLWRDVGVIAAAHDGCEDAAVRDLIADMLALADRLTAHCEDLP